MLKEIDYIDEITIKKKKQNLLIIENINDYRMIK